MTKRATTKCNLSLNLGLLVLLNFLGTAMLEDAHSLSCNVNIKAPTKAEPLWCKAQCSTDGNNYLSFNNVNKTMPLGNQGKMANATKVWTCLTHWLDLLCQELRDKVSENEGDTNKTSGHPSLKANMLSELNHGQIIAASWQFSISGNDAFKLDTMTGKWTLINPVPEDIMNEWKDDETLMKHLNLSIAECSQNLNESLIINQHEERTRATTRAPNITQPPPTSQVPYKEVLIPVGLIIFFIICICICMKRNCCTQGDAQCQRLRNCCINCHKPQRNEGPEETGGEVSNQNTEMLSQDEDPEALR